MALVNNLPKRDFIAIVFSLTAVTLLSWIYLIDMAKDMSSGSGSCCLIPAKIHHWDPAYFWMMFVMGAVMMVGMMVPSAAPMILIYAGIARKAKQEGNVIAPTFAFTFGYILMWTVFSLAATVLQWQLDKFTLLSPMMVSNSPKFGASILIAAGIYQWLPIKNSCLKHCRSPFHFISNHWKRGFTGAMRMGIEHGIFCIGCCWALMLLLFVGGVMNILWIALITVFVLLEKVLPLGEHGGRLSGILMILIGIIMLIK